MGDLLVQLLMAIGGGIGATYLNERFTDPNGILRPRAVGPVTLTPGAQVSVGLALALAFLPSSLLPRGTIRIGLGAMASGGIVTEGAEVLGEHVLPILRGEKAPAPQLPGGAPVAGYGWHGYGARVGYQPSAYEVARQASSLRAFGQA